MDEYPESVPQPWGLYDVPEHKKLQSLNHPTGQTIHAKALYAALIELFERYPERLPDSNMGASARWRSTALELAERGDLWRSMHYADDTGVPQGELVSLIALLTAHL